MNESLQMFRPAIRRTIRDRIIAAVAFFVLVGLVVLIILIERRNVCLGIRTPSIFLPSEVPR